MSSCSQSNRESKCRNPELPATSPTTDERQGFLGGELFTNIHNVRGDLQLVRRAIREQWPMKPEDRVLLWAKVTEIRSQHEGRVAKAADAILAAFKKTDSSRQTNMAEPLSC